MRQVSWVDERGRVGFNKHVRRCLTRTMSKCNCDTSARNIETRVVSGSLEVYVLGGQEARRVKLIGNL